MKEYLLRSLMFVPANNEKLLRSSINSEADALILDLEDSVQPYSNKQIARGNIKKWVEEKKFKNHIIFPRVNDRESGELLKDVMNLTIEGVEGFVYPKAKTAEDIHFFSKLLETIEYQKKIPINSFKIIPLIETTSAVLNIQEICEFERVIAVAFGSEDFISDLQGIHDLEHVSLFNPRAIIAMGARAKGVIPIDTVHIRVHDLEDLEKNLKISKNLGFEGMLVLHPKEIPIVHRHFSPSEQEIGFAKELISLSKQAIDNGKGVAILNGKFVGPPLVAKANSILQKFFLINSKSQRNE